MDGNYMTLPLSPQLPWTPEKTDGDLGKPFHFNSLLPSNFTCFLQFTSSSFSQLLLPENLLYVKHVLYYWAIPLDHHCLPFPSLPSLILKIKSKILMSIQIPDIIFLAKVGRLFWYMSSQSDYLFSKHITIPDCNNTALQRILNGTCSSSKYYASSSLLSHPTGIKHIPASIKSPQVLPKYSTNSLRIRSITHTCSLAWSNKIS